MSWDKLPRIMKFLKVFYDNFLEWWGFMVLYKKICIEKSVNFCEINFREWMILKYLCVKLSRIGPKFAKFAKISLTKVSLIKLIKFHNFFLTDPIAKKIPWIFSKNQELFQVFTHFFSLKFIKKICFNFINTSLMLFLA